MAASRNALAELSLNSPRHRTDGIVPDGAEKKLPALPALAIRQDSDNPSPSHAHQVSAISRYQTVGEQYSNSSTMDRHKHARKRWSLSKTRRLMGSRVSQGHNPRDVNGYPMGSQDLKELIKKDAPSMRSMSDITASPSSLGHFPVNPPMFPELPALLRIQDHVANHELKPTSSQNVMSGKGNEIDHHLKDPEKHSVSDHDAEEAHGDTEFIRMIEDKQRENAETIAQEIRAEGEKPPGSTDMEVSGNQGENPLRSIDVNVPGSACKQEDPYEPIYAQEPKKTPENTIQGAKPWEVPLNIQKVTNAKAEMAERSITSPTVQVRAELVDRESILLHRHSIGGENPMSARYFGPRTETFDDAQMRLLLAGETARMESMWMSWTITPGKYRKKKWRKCKVYVFEDVLYVETTKGLRKMKLAGTKTSVRSTWGYSKIFVTSEEHNDPITLAFKTRHSSEHVASIIRRLAQEAAANQADSEPAE